MAVFSIYQRFTTLPVAMDSWQGVPWTEFRKIFLTSSLAVGVRRPNHEKYRFHISLGYTRIVTEGENEARRQALIKKWRR